MTHADWIAFNYLTPDHAYGRCAEATAAMAAVFPDLVRVRGHYYCPVWGEREHWWCVTPAGAVIDPTASQFPSRGTGVYVPLDPAAPTPTGMCPECGAYCYDGDQFCCAAHAESYVRYLTTGVL